MKFHRTTSGILNLNFLQAFFGFNFGIKNVSSKSRKILEIPDSIKLTSVNRFSEIRMNDSNFLQNDYKHFYHSLNLIKISTIFEMRPKFKFVREILLKPFTIFFYLQPNPRNSKSLIYVEISIRSAQSLSKLITQFYIVRHFYHSFKNGYLKKFPATFTVFPAK